MYTRFDNWRDYWELLLLLPDYGSPPYFLPLYACKYSLIAPKQSATSVGANSLFLDSLLSADSQRD